MRQRAWLTGIAMLVALSPIVPAQGADVATAADKARARVVRFDVGGISRIDALMTLAQQYQIPLGIEYAGPELFSPVAANLMDTDVATVIATLFPSSLGFRVAMNGAIPVIGHRTLPPPTRNALDVVLPRITIRQTMPMFGAASQVWMTLARQLDPTIGGFAGSELGPPEARIPPMDLVGITVRETLNRLARQDGRAVWFVTVPPAQLDRGWKKTHPPMWSALQYDNGHPEAVGQLLALAMPDIAARVEPGPAAAGEPVRVASTLLNPRKVRHVAPVYPAAARSSRAEGIVIVELHVNEQGAVSDARVLRSRPPFDQAALDAVRQWRYEPLVFNGAPTSFIMSVVVDFAPPSSRRR
jgi:protein TonB